MSRIVVTIAVFVEDVLRVNVIRLALSRAGIFKKGKL